MSNLIHANYDHRGDEIPIRILGVTQQEQPPTNFEGEPFHPDQQALAVSLQEEFGPELLACALISPINNSSSPTNDTTSDPENEMLLILMSDLEDVSTLPILQEDDRDKNEMTSDQVSGLSIKIVGAVPDLHERVHIRQARLMDILKPVDSSKLMIMSLSGLWENFIKKNTQFINALVSCNILYDRGILMAIKQANLHCNAVREKFDQYVVFYALAGSIVRGTATEDSDIDVVIGIDDTDVQKMTRNQLQDKISQIISGSAFEIPWRRGMQPKLHATTLILTTLWQGLRECDPIVLSFLRDSVPLYDRGLLSPWKQLLRSGQISSTVEYAQALSINGIELLKTAEKKLQGIIQDDLFLSAVMPTQAIFHIIGQTSIPPKELPNVMQELQIDGRLIFQEEDVALLLKLTNTRKDFDHNRITIYSIENILQLLKDVKAYHVRVQSILDGLLLRNVQREFMLVIAGIQKLGLEILQAINQGETATSSVPELIQSVLENLEIADEKKAEVLNLLHTTASGINDPDPSHHHMVIYCQTAIKLQDELRNLLRNR